MNKLSKGQMIAVYVMTAIIAICLVGVVIMIRNDNKKQSTPAQSSAVTEVQSDATATPDVAGAKTVNEMVTELKGKMNLPESTTLSPDKITHYYELADGDAAELNGIVGDVALADELVIMKAADSSKVAALEAGANARLESQKKAFQDYIPEQYQRLEGAKIVVQGDYVMFVCSDNADAIVDQFRTMVGE